MKEITLDQIKQRLTKVGWFPERDKKQEALKQIEKSIADAASQGFSFRSLSNVETFLRSFIGIEIEISNDGRWSTYIAIGDWYGNDLDAMMELAEEQKSLLFPVGLEITELNGSLYEILIICMDSKSQFFGIHWSGHYYLGANEWETFQNLMARNYIEV